VLEELAHTEIFDSTPSDMAAFPKSVWQILEAESPTQPDASRAKDRHQSRLIQRCDSGTDDSHLHRSAQAISLASQPLTRFPTREILAHFSLRQTSISEAGLRLTSV